MRAALVLTYICKNVLFLSNLGRQQSVESSGIAVTTSRRTGKAGRRTFIIDYFFLNEKKESVNITTTSTLTFLLLQNTR
jgi:hypothetical protein